MTRSPSAPDQSAPVPGCRESIVAAGLAAVLVGRIEACGGGALVAAVALTIALFVPDGWRSPCLGVAAIACIVALVESVFVVPTAVRNFRVEIVTTGLLVHRGVAFRTVDHIPRAKITVVRSQDGPLLRHLGVAKCVLFTPAREIVLLPMSTGDVERMMKFGIDG